MPWSVCLVRRDETPVSKRGVRAVRHDPRRKSPYWILRSAMMTRSNLRTKSAYEDTNETPYRTHDTCKAKWSIQLMNLRRLRDIMCVSERKTMSQSSVFWMVCFVITDEAEER
jgi:hypothetical protein